MLGDYATADAVASLRAKLGLDLPVMEQYFQFIRHAATGDLGTSVVTGQAALTEVFNSLPWSISLTLWGMIIARSEEHTSELQSLMRISYAVFCLKKKTTQSKHIITTI